MKVLIQVVLVMALLISSAYSEGADPASTKPRDAFARLKGLVGTWKVKDSTGDFRIVFEAISGNTALLETWMDGSSKHSITVYHIDDERLVATHYCPQGNQPRLQLDTESGEDLLEFGYFDATGIESADESHQHYLSYDFGGSRGVLIRGEKYLKNGNEEASSLTLVRDR